MRLLTTLLLLAVTLTTAACSGGRESAPVLTSALDADKQEITAVLSCPKGKLNTNHKDAGDNTVIITGRCED